MNIYDVAKKAGVSIATVSRALNNSENVSSATKQKVQDVMSEMNFIPNGVARSLATNRTKTIGIMVSDIRNNFHFQTAYELEKLLYKEGYSSMLCNTTEKLDQKLNYLNLLIEKKVDAIITVGAVYGEEELLKNLREINQEIPIVLLNNFDSYLISVYCDESKGVTEAVKYLNKKGYKNPIFVSDDKEFRTRAYNMKLKGFKIGLEKYYPKNNFIELSVEDSEEGTKNLVKQIKRLEHVDCIQFEKDTIAIKFLKAALEENFKVPQELGIVGFDNIDLTNYTPKKNIIC